MDATWTIDSANNRVSAPRMGATRLDARGYEMDCERLSFGDDFGACHVSGRCEAESVFDAPAQRERHIYLQFLLEGECTFLSERLERRMTARTPLLLSPDRTGAAWQIGAGDTTSVFSIDISEDRLAGWLGGSLSGDISKLLKSRAPEAQLLVMPALPGWQRMIATLSGEAGPPLRRMAVEGMAIQLLATYLDHLTGDAARDGSEFSRQEERLVHEARERLLADLRTPPSASDLAREAGMSPRRLDRAFREFFGASIFRTLADARLDHAQELLTGGGLSIKEIAWRVGYSHPTSFTHAFRERFGIPPTELGKPARRH